MYAQLMKEILTELPYSAADAKYMTGFCLIRYIKEPATLENIVHFDCEYRPQATANWYTKNNFPFEMVHTALRTHDRSTLYAMRVYSRCS
jgi:hypothetical protein